MYADVVTCCDFADKVPDGEAGGRDAAGESVQRRRPRRSGLQGSCLCNLGLLRDLGPGAQMHAHHVPLQGLVRHSHKSPGTTSFFRDAFRTAFYF